ncbi:hypothetical protein CMEL01_14887 [Colletotrichum melonis]|uniref:Uncharacterized protein n=1 Tax=Colletotrichum melonis TaxID=1209925 RepID=A0AAI9XSC9_9PEZI|nr:hypothetical protein CMEL01_14887 [Colletotrichum melonis]
MDDGMTGVRPCPPPSKVSDSPAQKEQTQHESWTGLRPHALWLVSSIEKNRMPRSIGTNNQPHKEADTDVPGTTSNAIASEPTMQPGCPSPRGCCRCNYHSRA